MGNALTVQTDSFAGFRANAMAVLNNSNSTVGTSGTSGGNANTNGWGLGADFTFNKAFVTAQYQSFKQQNSFQTSGAQIFNAAGAGLVAITSTTPGGGGATGAITTPVSVGNNIQDNQFYAAATYDFGILKAYGQYLNRKATATYNSAFYASRTAEQIGVRSFITPKVEAWASAGLGRYHSAGATEPTANFNAWQLGSNYLLSKRTNLYAIYGTTRTSTYTTGAGSTNSNSGQNYAVGVRHTF
jgi:hypothetical protein